MTQSSAPEQIMVSRLADVQVMRGIAVLMVIVFHLDHEWLPHGFIGVDIFFSISGFIISLGLLRAEGEGSTFQAVDFLGRRVKRLLPALLLTIGAVLLFGFLLYPQGALVDMGWSAMYALAGLSNFWFFASTDYFSAPLSTMPLLHTWSLGVEEQFYVGYSLLLAVGTRWLRVRTTLALGFVPLTIASYLLHKVELAPLVMVEPIANLGLENVKESMRFFAMPFRIAEFGVGVIAALLATSRFLVSSITQFSWRLLWCLGVVLLVALALDIFRFDEHSTKVTIGSSALAAMVLFAGFRGDIGTARVLASKGPLQFIWNQTIWLGDRSYSLYLVHWPVIVFYAFVTFRSNSLLDYLTLVALILIAGQLSYRLAERRSRRPPVGSILIGRGSKAINDISAFQVIVPIYLLLFSFLIVDSGGFSWRIPSPEIPAEIDPTLIDGFANRRSLYVTEPNGHWVNLISKVNNAEAEPQLRVLVLGDSHAGHLNSLGAFLAAYGNVEWTQYTFTGCTPLFGYTKVYGDGVGGEKQEACTRQVTLWQQFLEAHSGVFDFVVLANRWNMLFNPGEIAGLSVREDRLTKLPFHGQHPSIDQSRAYFSEALIATVRVIDRAGAKTIILGQAPMKYRSAEGCDRLPRYLIPASYIANRCQSPLDDAMLTRSVFVDETIARVADIEPSALAVVLSEHFCPNGVCSSVIGDRSLYRDDNHLNGVGAMYLLRSWMESPNFPFADALAKQEIVLRVRSDALADGSETDRSRR